MEETSEIHGRGKMKNGRNRLGETEKRRRHKLYNNDNILPALRDTYKLWSTIWFVDCPAQYISWLHLLTLFFSKIKVIRKCIVFIVFL